MQTAIYIVVSVLVLLLIVLFNKRRIISRLIKLFNGKYSYKYSNYFHKITGKYPFSMGIKDDLVNHYEMFFKSTNEERFTVKKALNFTQAKYLSDEKEVVLEKGEPDTFNVSLINGSNELRIYGYEDLIFGLEMRVHYYFIDEKFFMGELVFKQMDKLEDEFVSKKIQEKYLGKVAIEDNSSYMICGTEDSFIHYSDTGFNVLVKYYTASDSSITTALKDSLIEFKKSHGLPIDDQEQFMSLI